MCSRFLGGQHLAFLPGPGVEPGQVRQQQHGGAPAGGAPLGRAQQLACQAPGLAQGAGAAAAGQVHLGQVPGAARCEQGAFVFGLQLGAAAQGLFGQRGHGGFGDQGRGRVGVQPGEGHAGRSQGQQHHALVGAGGGGQQGVFGAGAQHQHGVGGAGGELGHHAGHGAARGLQGLQCVAQPGAVANGHPGAGAGACAGLQREMQLCGVVQQAVFEQAFQHVAQARAVRPHAGGQGHALPGQRAHRHQGHDLAGAPHGGQRAGGRGAVARGLVAVCAERVAVFGGATIARQGEVKDEGAHGKSSRAIVGGVCVRPAQDMPGTRAPVRSRQTVVASRPMRRTSERSCTTVGPMRRRPCTSK